MKKLFMAIALAATLIVATGGFHSVFAQAQRISNIDITDVSDTEAIVTWETAAPCVSSVRYGKTEQLKNKVELDSDNQVTHHTITLTELTPDTEYFFKINAGAKKERAQAKVLNFRTRLASDDALGQAVSPFDNFKISAPLAGSFVSDSVMVSFEGSALSSLDRVALSVDDEMVTSMDSAPFEYELDTTLFENGSRTICADGYDAQGEKFSHCVSVVAKNGRAAASFRFAVIGDTRSGHSTHRKIVSELKGLNPKPVMIFNSGDLTANGSSSEWSNWKNINSPLGINWNVDPPQYIGAYGNHDGGSSSWKKYLVGQQRYNDGKSFAIGYGNALFLNLNSQNNTSKAWIEKTLKAEAPKYDWIFAFWHHPPYPFGSKSMDSSYRDFGPTLQKYGAKIVFVGHAHYYVRSYPMLMDGSKNPKRDDENGIVQIVTGGAGAPLYSVSKNVPYKHLYAKGAQTNHYCVVDITNNVLNMTVKNQNGKVIDTLRMELSGGSDKPPTVDILNPKNNQTVKGMQTVSANATDDKGVSKVEFYADNSLIQTDTSSPYSINWDSTRVSDGSHTIKAIAFDTANQSTTATVSITVNNNSNPGNQTIASDDLETYGWTGGKGWTGGWTKIGDIKKVKMKPYSGKKYARLRAKATSLERIVDLSNVSNPVLTFAGRVRSFEAGDRAVVKVSNDGNTYYDAAVFTSTESDNIYHVQTIDLSRFNPGRSFRIKFSAEMSKKTDYWYLDKISIEGVK